MFDDLDDFLNESPAIPASASAAEPAQADTITIDLDLSIPEVGKARKNRNDKPIEPSAEYVPAKGQKTAARRLNKIKKTLAEQHSPVIDNPVVVSRKLNKATAAKRTTGRRRNRQYDEFLVDSDDDSIRMMTPPVARRQHSRVIEIDCDDVFAGGPEVRIERDLGAAPACTADDNAALEINVRIGGTTEVYELRRKLTELAAQIAAKKCVPADHVVFMFRNKFLSSNESPDSIGYIRGMALMAHVSDDIDQSVQNNNVRSGASKPKEGQIEIKIQIASRKRPFTVYVSKEDKLKRVACECAEEFKCDITKIRLEFDGEMVDYEDTSEALDLEGGEIFDLFIAK